MYYKSEFFRHSLLSNDNMSFDLYCFEEFAECIPLQDLFEASNNNPYNFTSQDRSDGEIQLPNIPEDFEVPYFDLSGYWRNKAERAFADPEVYERLKKKYSDEELAYLFCDGPKPEEKSDDYSPMAAEGLVVDDPAKGFKPQVSKSVVTLRGRRVRFPSRYADYDTRK